MLAQLPLSKLRFVYLVFFVVPRLHDYKAMGLQNSSTVDACSGHAHFRFN